MDIQSPLSPLKWGEWTRTTIFPRMRHILNHFSFFQHGMKQHIGPRRGPFHRNILGLIMAYAIDAGCKDH